MVFCSLWAGNNVAAEMPPATVLIDQAAAFDASSNLLVWLEPGRTSTIEQVIAAPGKFTAAGPDAQHALDRNNTLWVKLRLSRPPGSQQAWALNIPLPVTDSVVLYQDDGANGRTTQAAGNRVPQSMWGKHGLYPEFDLALPAGTDQDIYLQVRNFKSLNLPLRFTPAKQRDVQRLGEFVALGAILGSLLSLFLLSLIRYVEHRNQVDLLASAYGLSITLMIAALHGLTGAVLWSDTLWWSSYAQAALPPITMGLALLFLRNLYALSTHHRRYDTLLVSIGWLTIASSLSLLLDRAAAHLTITAVTFAAAIVGMIVSLMGWRFRSAIGRLLFASYMLQFIAFMRLIAESLSLVPYYWEFRYLTSLAIGMSVPLLMYALNRATHDRKELALRASHLPNQDALTGLLTRNAFMKHYEAA